MTQGWPPNTPQSIPDDPKKFRFFDPRGLLEAEGRPANMMIDMIIKIVIFDIFTQVPGQTAILAGFAAFFYADSCRRYVNSSFLSPFHDQLDLNNQKHVLVLVLLRFFLTWKIAIFDMLTQVQGQTAILAGFAAFFMQIRVVDMSKADF